MTSRIRRIRNAGARGSLWVSAMISSAVMLFLIGYICFRGLPAVSWAFLTGQESILHGTAGILPAVLNTLYVIAASLAVVLPLGVGAAVYLTEYARNRWLVRLVEFAAETLAGIPSVLYAMAGGIVFCEKLGLGRTLLAGSFTLAVMTLPTVLRAAQESLKTVPVSCREGALGLGSGKWQMIRTVVLPLSADGIAAGCILTVGRVVGESAVLIYTAGLSTVMQDLSTFEGIYRASGATLTAALYVYAKERADLAEAFAIAVVLLFLTAALNLAVTAVRHVRTRKGRQDRQRKGRDRR